MLVLGLLPRYCIWNGVMCLNNRGEWTQSAALEALVCNKKYKKKGEGGYYKYKII